MKVSVVVVSWNSRDDLVPLSNSLQACLSDKYELIVVDNFSSDDSVEVAKALPHSRVIPLTENRGFGIANNIGVDHAIHDAVALLNPDVRLLDDNFSRLGTFALAHHCLCGPRVLNPDGTVQPSCSPLPASGAALLSAALPAVLLPRQTRRRAVPWEFDEKMEVGWLTGCAVVAPRELLRELGPFDPTIHMYSEDLDLGLRARHRGYRSFFLPDCSRVIHIGDTSSSRRFVDSGKRLSIENRFHVVARRLGRAPAQIDYRANVFGVHLRLLLKGLLFRDTSRERSWLWSARMAATGTARKSRGRSTALVLHTGLMSGPTKNFVPRLVLAAAEPNRYVFSPTDGPGVELYGAISTVHIFPFSTLSFSRSPREMLAQARQLFKDIVAFTRHFKAVDAGCVVSVTTYTPAAYIASRLLGLPTVVYCGEIFSDSWRAGWRRAVVGHAMRAFVPRVADVVICCSDMARQQFPSNRRAKLVTLYPAIDISPPPEPESALRARYGLPVKGEIVSVIGQIAPSRGQDVALRAISELVVRRPDLVLAIAGEPGSHEDDQVFASSLYDLIAKLGIEQNVRFLGHVKRVEEVIAMSSLVINPCRFDEPFGRTAYEALALGKPVVLSDAGALSELLSHEETALFFTPEDPFSLADAVDRLLTDPAMGARMVQKAQPIVRSLDQASNDQKFMQLFSAVT